MGVMGAGAVVLLCKRIKIGDHWEIFSEAFTLPFRVGETLAVQKQCGF